MINDIKDLTSFKWATVTGVAPLQIRLDGDTDPLALIPDSLVDPVALGAGDRVRVELSLRKCVIHGVANGSDFGPGDLIVTASNNNRPGWLSCEGQSLWTGDYPRLFAAIGTTYGSVDATHFNLPNLRGRVVVGITPNQVIFDTLGKVGGSNTETLTLANMPTEVAKYRQGVGTLIDSTNAAAGATQWGASPAVAAGATTAHNNLQPYIVLRYLIKT